ncbi:alpha/beta hydrolase [Sneathiella aquimaris]|uniref:alpha/beta hydrolase n=1 Tax=Sneathiella aquimaris TaxID=2599305 RepID=UPI00146ECBFD|nr:alpha/beta hydrolase [Sneathiella aquimaris]
MNLDPQAKWVLDIAEQIGAPPFEEMTATEAKAAYEKRAVKLTKKDVPTGGITDLAIDGPNGAIPIRLYTPVDASEKLPVLVYYHGGGWVVGSPDTHDALCRIISNQGPFIVLSVDYRMGPEAKFPAAIEDAYAAYQWTIASIKDHGGDPSRIAVGGDSAGGNISAVISLLARDNSIQSPTAQWLIYPATNMEMQTASHRDFADGYFLTNALMTWFQNHYLRRADDRSDWRASPLIADSLANLPPALIQTAGFDPLKDEGKAYADRMSAEGSKAAYTDYPGMIHGFINLGGAIDTAQVAIDEGVTYLQRAFKR